MISTEWPALACPRNVSYRQHIPAPPSMAQRFNALMCKIRNVLPFLFIFLSNSFSPNHFPEKTNHLIIYRCSQYIFQHRLHGPTWVKKRPGTYRFHESSPSLTSETVPKVPDGIPSKHSAITCPPDGLTMKAPPKSIAMLSKIAVVPKKYFS